MSGEPDALARVVGDARAVIETLLASGWRDVHIVSGGTEIFAALDGGRPNPMRTTVSSPPDSPLAEVRSETVTAPHVATLVDFVAIGTSVSAGDPIATIRVLDDEETIAAPETGRVTAIHADPGTLIEFGSPILSLEAGR